MLDSPRGKQNMCDYKDKIIEEQMKELSALRSQVADEQEATQKARRDLFCIKKQLEDLQMTQEASAITIKDLGERVRFWKKSSDQGWEECYAALDEVADLRGELEEMRLTRADQNKELQDAFDQVKQAEASYKGLSEANKDLEYRLSWSFNARVEEVKKRQAAEKKVAELGKSCELERENKILRDDLFSTTQARIRDNDDFQIELFKLREESADLKHRLSSAEGANKTLARKLGSERDYSSQETKRANYWYNRCRGSF